MSSRFDNNENSYEHSNNSSGKSNTYKKSSNYSEIDDDEYIDINQYVRHFSTSSGTAAKVNKIVKHNKEENKKRCRQRFV